MTLTLAQRVKRVVGDLWTWRIYLSGEHALLDGVREVRYRLHRSFANPNRVVTDRASNFELKSKGWGEFAIYATVVSHNGSEQRLQHWLKLRAEDDEAAALGQPQGPELLSRPRVFISHGAADAPFAERLQLELEEMGVRTARAETLMYPGASMAETVQDVIAEVPVGLVVVSPDAGFRVEAEVQDLLDNNTFLVPVVLSPDSGQLGDMLRGFQAVSVANPSNPDDGARAAAALTRDIIDNAVGPRN